jgi:hypothetical protein
MKKRHLAIDQRMLGIGGAPTRATTLPTDSQKRKQYPVASGVLDYFSDALVAISHVSWTGNAQHNPGKPLHWNRDKSQDEADTLIRHFLQRGTWDTDGERHSAKMAWRALALLQKEIEMEQQANENRRANKRVRRLSTSQIKSKQYVRRANNRSRTGHRNRRRTR